MKRETGIICTLGPASHTVRMIAQMADMGMNIARLNASHGTHETFQPLIDSIRTVNRQNKKRIKILLDLEGPRIRVGELSAPIPLANGQRVEMAAFDHLSCGVIPFDFPGNVRDIAKGSDLFIDDGQIHLIVKGHRGKRLILEVLQGGFVKSRKGVNIPRFRLKQVALSEKDQADIQFGLERQVDSFAQSFVTGASDIRLVTRLVAPVLPDCKVIAKIENYDGIENIVSIIRHCDGAMIARGDMGVSLPLYKVPFVQKYLIRQCIRRQKMTVVATQMLESMVDHIRPTRAEVSDVANAILDGTDFVMLSAESAVGKYPLQCVDMMRQIIEFTEKYENRKI
jgi:pyruvate kinase